MTNSNASKRTTLNVNLAITHVDGTQPSMEEVLAWLSRCVNCNPNHARVEVRDLSVGQAPTAQSKATPSSEERGLMTDEQYVASNGIRCPSCGGLDLSGQQIEVDGASAFQPMGCSACDARWSDVYVLAGYADLEDGINFDTVGTVLNDIESRRKKHEFSIENEAQAREVVSESCEVLDVSLSDAETKLAVEKLLA